MRIGNGRKAFWGGGDKRGRVSFFQRETSDILDHAVHGIGRTSRDHLIFLAKKPLVGVHDIHHSRLGAFWQQRGMDAP